MAQRKIKSAASAVALETSSSGCFDTIGGHMSPGQPGNGSPRSGGHHGNQPKGKGGRSVSDSDPDTDNVQRWTARRKSALVLSLIKGETTAQEAARKHGLTVAELEDWREKALAGQENALRSRPRDEQGQADNEIKRLKQKVGELVMDNDILKEAVRISHPLESAAFRE